MAVFGITPVPELAGALEADSESYRNERVTVVGAHDGLRGPVGTATEKP